MVSFAPYLFLPIEYLGQALLGGRSLWKVESKKRQSDFSLIYLVNACPRPLVTQKWVRGSSVETTLDAVLPERQSRSFLRKGINGTRGEMKGRVMRRRIRRGALFLGGLVTSILLLSIEAAGGAAAVEWPHQESDLEPDSSVSWGALENGFRYAIMPNGEPPEKVSLRLHVGVGSLMEEEDQRGLAHFLEHMAFNGSRNFSGGDLIEYLQRLGMDFGADTNAYTSWKETVYFLELPDSRAATLREGLTVLRDYADGLLLDPIQIEQERGVILSEKRTRDSIEYRLLVDELKFLFPDALIPQRMAIGVESVIESASRERFVDFYEKWYTTERMVLVAVGDVLPGELVSMIGEFFSSMEASPERRVDPRIGEVSGEGISLHVSREPEAPWTKVSIQSMQPFRTRPDSFERRRDELYRSIATAAINRRLEILAKEEGASFRSGVAYAYDWLDFVEIAGIELQTTPELWKRALTTAEMELRRALIHGFTGPELDERKADLANSYEERVKAASSRQSRMLARSLVRSIAKRKVFTSPVDDLAMVRRFLEEASAEDILAAIRGAWSADNTYLLIGGKISAEDEEGDILEVYSASREVEVEPPAEVAQKIFAYGMPEETGEITSRRTDRDLGITQVRFGNQVRYNYKRTDFEQNSIHVRIRFGGGLLTAPRDLPGLPLLASTTYVDGGLGKHSADEIKRIFAGKTVAVNFAVEDDSFVLAGRTSPEALSEQLLLMRGYLVDPGYRQEALRQAHKLFERVYLEAKQDLRGVLGNEVARLIRGGDERFGLPERELMMERTLEEVEGWLEEYLMRSYLEISIAGDFDEEETLELVGRTFGRLPERRESKPPYLKERELLFARDRSGATFWAHTEIPKAISAVYWPTDDIWDISRTRRLSLLASVLEDRMRLRIREDLGEVYSIRVSNRPSDTFSHFGVLRVITVSNPPQADQVAELLQEIAEELRLEGVTGDELDRALRPLLTGLKDWVRNNRYWLETVMASSQEYPQRLDWAKSMIPDYQSITVEDIDRMARRFLAPENGLAVTVVPVSSSDP